MEEVRDMLGHTCTRVAVDRDLDSVTFYLAGGAAVGLYHEQDCCESVTIESIVGDIEDLVGEPLLLAEMVTNSDIQGDEGRDSIDDSGCFTWTFYKFATRKGYVDIRWFGTSNGYYSEKVDFHYMKHPIK